VIAIGNALALPGDPTVTVDVVSALGRSIESTPGVTSYDLIQTDTSINPGNSGGTLIDLDGNLAGINTAVLRGTGGRTSIDVEGIGFAINVETAQQVAQQLVELGRVRWAWMRVFLADLVPEVAPEVGLPIREGVIIQNTVVDGPFGRAGIIPGDIVVKIAGQDIATVSDFTRLLKQEFSAGQQVEVEVFRVVDGDGSRKTLTLELGERPQQ
jgi:S1-C subfamily serine protease